MPQQMPTQGPPSSEDLSAFVAEAKLHIAQVLDLSQHPVHARFFSAVCARQGDGSHHQPVDADRIMVRARLRGHLDALTHRYPELLGDCEIQATPHSDYAFRLFVPKTVWADVVSTLTLDTGYDNFKSAVQKHQGREGRAYNEALHDVWSVMHDLQQR